MGVFKGEVTVKEPTVEEVKTIIGAKTVLKGELASEENVRIEGKVEGKLIASADVEIGRGGEVRGEIKARSIVIKGRMFGNVTAENRLELVPQCQMLGDISSPKLVIGEGVFFEGNCLMDKEKVKREGEGVGRKAEGKR